MGGAPSGGMEGVALDRNQVLRVGLDPDVVEAHRRKVRTRIRAGRGVTFEILEVGGRKNGIVLDLSSGDGEQLVALGRAGLKAGRLCTFVPAAGAASRYLKLFQELAAALETGELLSRPVVDCLEEIRRLGDLGDLPFEVELPASQADGELIRWALEVREKVASLPKGLVPATLEGKTFFELKLREHGALNPFGPLCLVVGEGVEGAFRQCFARAGGFEGCPDSVSFLVQGSQLSTLRFDGEGVPVIGEDGGYVPVVGGHGELIHLFPQVAALGGHRSILVYNIDNVIGDSGPVVEEFTRFYGFHHRWLELLDRVREACGERRVSSGLARQLRAGCREVGVELLALPDGEAGEEDSWGDGALLLEEIQERFFHTDWVALAKEGEDRWELLLRLWSRPLSVLGVVPNNGRDVGGIPAVIELGGARVKICLEMPHASARDQKEIFRNPRRATHFNPAFVLHELVPDRPARERTDPRFWMLTRKPYAGRDVYYHETVLYEAIGNSLTNNLLFVEISRRLFRPHKVFTDCRGRSLGSYGFCCE